MLTDFINHIKKSNLFSNSAKILLTVSGGKDSMAMLDLFYKAGFNISVAHCNFNLRGAESDADEQFVKVISEQNNILFFSKSFNTTEFAEKNKISIQMAARKLRYDWFEEIRLKHDIDYIATAHHKNDVAETMLINLTKGTGLSGLHGINKKSGKIIRPLLDFTREQIEDYVAKNNIEYREDKSNQNNKYTRNFVRLDVIPLLENINPNLIENLNQTANYIASTEFILAEKIQEEFKKCTEQNGNRILFDISKLKSLKNSITYLYYFLKDFGFNGTDFNNIIDAFDEQSGKIFLSKTHQILKDRDKLVLSEISIESNKEIIIHNIDELSKNGFFVEVYCNDKGIKINKSSNYAYLDENKIKFPLVLRNWKEGDTFQPLGMKGKKKLSDFFIDNKIDVLTKQNIKVLTQKNKIIWVVGYRINDTFKIEKNTKNILVIKC
ncbi:tRNA lysidine(34) synthetase TilS [Vicingus serpentipes]|uniref:tRNA(Ile)-lysidine synthase n=1 Tax=Vicingus serpentipes TaxID=1926625 RepID=A0A5C6RS00_9FLAO|nr:tRNA lysidine(34) synthetase TilS [Vicingus serpentipes]TXB65206.1 tRNA lysidine(34) synthetase TilS [Vicingus serpentipes]